MGSNGTDAQLGRVAELAAAQLQLEAAVAGAEQDLRNQRNRLAAIAEKELPDLMAELGLRDFTTTDGLTITVKDVMQVSVTGKYRAAIFEWLRANDHDSLISHKVTASFGRGEATAAATALLAVQDLGGDAQNVEEVNAGTFKALMKELLADGREVPIDALGVHVMPRSNIKVKT